MAIKWTSLIAATLVGTLTFFELTITGRAVYAWRWARRASIEYGRHGRRKGRFISRDSHGGLVVPVIQCGYMRDIVA